MKSLYPDETGRKMKMKPQRTNCAYAVVAAIVNPSETYVVPMTNKQRLVGPDVSRGTFASLLMTVGISGSISTAFAAVKANSCHISSSSHGVHLSSGSFGS